MHKDPVMKGFTLLEVLVAMALLALAVAGVAGLAGVARQSATAARSHTMATLLAAQKMEQLLALTWRLDLAGSGLPESDTSTDLSYDPPQSGGAGLNASPAGTLQSDTAGYVDYMDAAGRWLGRGAPAPAAAAYVRRWSVQASPLNADARVIQVLVRPARRSSAGADIVLSSIKTRKPS